MKQVSLGWRTGALLAGIAALPVVAWAQSATRTIDLNANVTPFCTFTSSAPTISESTNITVNSNTLSVSTIAIANPTNASGIAQGAAFLYSIGASCNAPSNATITSISGGMKNSISAAVIGSNYGSRIDYKATVQWGLAADFTTGGASASATSASGGPREGTVAVTVLMQPQTSLPLAAGDYADILRVQLAPQ